MSNIIRVDEGDREELTPEEYREAGGSRFASMSLMAYTNHLIHEGQLADEVDANENVVERALEEDDVFHGRMEIPGWFINNDDELSDEFGHRHNGETVTVEGLMESYSEAAFRVIAREVAAPGHRAYTYAWFFVPKSVVTVETVEGMTDEDLLDFEADLSEARQRHRDALDAEWEAFQERELDEKIDSLEAE